MAASIAKPNGTKARRPRAHLKPEEKHQIITLAENNPNLTHDQIADLTGVHTRTVITKLLNNYGIERDRVDDYKNQRADILAGMQERVLRCKYGTDEAIKKMPDAAAILLFNSCFNAERLERGQTTENVGVLVAAIQERKKRKSVDNISHQPNVPNNVIDAESEETNP